MYIIINLFLLASIYRWDHLKDHTLQSSQNLYTTRCDLLEPVTERSWCIPSYSSYIYIKS